MVEAITKNEGIWAIDFNRWAMWDPGVTGGRRASWGVAGVQKDSVNLPYAICVGGTSVEFSGYLDTCILYECQVSSIPPFHDYQKYIPVKWYATRFNPHILVPSFPKLDMHSSIQVSRKLDTRSAAVGAPPGGLLFKGSRVGINPLTTPVSTYRFWVENFGKIADFLIKDVCIKILNIIVELQYINVKYLSMMLHGFHWFLLGFTA